MSSTVPWSEQPILVVMGVSGCGKSTIAALLAAELGWDFEECDDLHPAANIAKMAAGHPLNDDDRQPWLNAVQGWIRQHVEQHRPGIITCSALKRTYRDRLRAPQVTFIYLHGTQSKITARLAKRRGHYMPPTLLDSQFADLEPPVDDENALWVDIEPPPGVQVSRILGALGRAGASLPDRKPTP
jgi:carbohydrate kinase (thermoresistant glucokinase family)